jgi:hypothetical protein
VTPFAFHEKADFVKRLLVSDFEPWNTREPVLLAARLPCALLERPSLASVQVGVRSSRALHSCGAGSKPSERIAVARDNGGAAWLP